MIKLKIGDNFLITSNNDLNHRYFITYMMGCFEGHNKTVIGLDIFGHNGKASFEINLDNGFDDYIKAIKSDKVKELFILVHKNIPNDYPKDSYIIIIKAFLQKLLLSIPDIRYKIIKIEERNEDNKKVKVVYVESKNKKDK